MVRKNTIAALLVGAAIPLLGGLESKAEPVPLNQSTNVNFGVASGFYGPATGDVNRVTRYKFEAGIGPNVDFTGTPGSTNIWVISGDHQISGLAPAEGHDLVFDGTQYKSFSGGVATYEVTNSPIRNVYISGTPKQYGFVFIDEKAGVNVTNSVSHGSNFLTNFPHRVYQDDDINSGIAYDAESITATGVDVGVLDND